MMEARRYNLEANEVNVTEISLLSQPNYSHTASETISPENYNISSDVPSYIAENVKQNQSNYEQRNLYQEISSYAANGFSQLVSTAADALSNLAGRNAENTANQTISNTTNASLEVILPETSTESSPYSNAVQMLSELGPYSNYYGQPTSNNTTINLATSETSTFPTTSNTSFSIEQDLSPTWNDTSTLSTSSAISKIYTTESTGFFHQISDKIQEAGTFIVNKTESLFNCSTIPCYETDGVLTNSTSSKQAQDEKSNQFLYVIITLCILVVVGILSGAFLVRKIRNKKRSFDVTMTNKAYL